MKYLDIDNYLLTSKTAKDIYLTVKNAPLVDLYNKIPLITLVSNKQFTDIWDFFAATDHHIWELMRRKRISEDYISGNKPNKDKWKKLASIFPQIGGNPIYQLVYFNLKHILRINERIDESNAELIWNKSIEKLQSTDFYPNKILEYANVKMLYFSCDPTVTLSQLKNQKTQFKISPVLAINKLLEIDSPEFINYINELDSKYSTDSTHFSGYKEMIEKIIKYFIEFGCTTSVINIFKPHFRYIDDLKAAYIYSKTIRQEPLTSVDVKEFQSFMTYFLLDLFKSNNIVTQLHIGTFRNYRGISETNTDGDVTSNFIDIENGFKELLNNFGDRLNLIIYLSDMSLLYSTLAIARLFPGLHMGLPFSFNNSFTGIYNYLNSITTMDILSNFAGFASNSSNIISIIPKNEIFKRALSQLIADYIDRGEISEIDGKYIINKICYNNPKCFK
jgi:glucuronate isomerase